MNWKITIKTERVICVDAPNERSAREAILFMSEAERAERTIESKTTFGQ